MRSLVLTTLITSLLMVGCSDFGDLNEDPNNPAQPRTDLLLSQAEKSVGSAIGTVTGNLYVQYLAETQYTEESRYDGINYDWDRWYTTEYTTVSDRTVADGPLFDLQTIIDLNSNPDTRDESYVLAGGSNTNQLAVARILKTYFFHMMTDRWGNIPYSEALQGNDELTPAYDPQQAIYDSMLTTLQNAASNLNTNQATVSGDFLFDGDLEKWRLFANTLRMRMAMRLTEVNASKAQSHFMDAYNNGYLQETAWFPFQASANNENPWYSRFETRTDYAISNTLGDTMLALDDMRVTAYADPAGDLDDEDGTTEMSEISTMPYGVDGETAGAISATAVSFPGMAMRAQGADLPIISMAEVHFMLAEAAQRGWNVSGSAQAHYESGIQASWEQWGVYNQSDFQAYMNQSEVQYDANNWRQSIGFQKWIALYPIGYQGWSEWRRLGYPELEPAPAAFEGRDIPVRQGYPGSEPDLNSSNYQEAVSEQGDGSFDPLATHVWWDTTP